MRNERSLTEVFGYQDLRYYSKSWKLLIIWARWRLNVSNGRKHWAITSSAWQNGEPRNQLPANFPNLECLAKSTWLDSAALLRGDLPTVLALVQQGLDSPEHAEFAASPRQPRSEPAG